MALDKITKKNYLSKGAPFLTVYSGWYNVIVDTLNAMTDNGFTLTSSGGLTTNASGQIPGLPLSTPPSTHHVFFDDFAISGTSAAPEATWTVTEDTAGATQLLIDAAGGAIQLVNTAATDNDAQQIQLQQESFKLALGKKLWFETRIRVPEADVTNVDFFVGLCVTEDLTGVADNYPANGLGFAKTDGATGIYLDSSDNGTNIVSAASLKTLVTNTWTRLGFYFDGGATGAATVTPYIDGVKGVPITAVTYATMSELAPIFMVRNGDNVTTQKLDIDYVYVVQER